MIRNNSKFASVLIASLSAAAVLGFGLKEADPLAAVTVSKEYHSDDAGSIEFVGACHATPKAIDCWDADGNPAPDLSQKVGAYYLVQNNTELTFKLNRKNRLVVFRRSEIPPSGYGFGLATINGQNSRQAGQLVNFGARNEPYLVWFNVDAAAGDKTTTATFDLRFSMGAGSLPLKVGGEGEVGNMRVRITGIKRSSPKPGYHPFEQNRAGWTVSTAITGYSSSLVPGLSGSAYDADNQPIQQVDRDGNPALSAMGRPGVRPDSWPSDASVSTEEGGGTLKPELRLPVKPSKVARIQLRADGIRKVTVTDILLDPK